MFIFGNYWAMIPAVLLIFMLFLGLYLIISYEVWKVGAGIIMSIVAISGIILSSNAFTKETNDINKAEVINEDKFYSIVKKVSQIDQLNSKTMNVDENDVKNLRNSGYVEMSGIRNNKDVDLKISFKNSNKMIIEVFENKTDHNVDVEKYEYDVLKNSKKWYWIIVRGILWA